MARIWTAPITYKYKQVMSAALSNEQLRDNLEYLKMKPRTYAPLALVTNDVLAATTTYQAVNDLNWAVSIATSEANEEVFVYFQCLISLSAGTPQALLLDVLVDNTNYLSSGTPTPITNGVGFFLFATTSATSWGFRKRLIIPTIGTHTFKLRARVAVTSCNVTFFTANAAGAEFGVQVE